MVFLVEPMVSYTNAFEVLFKSVDMHLVATYPIVNKPAKLWCFSVPNLVQNFSVKDQFIFISCHLHDKCFSFPGVYSANTYLARRFLWRNLISLIGTWCILGDFNVVLSTDACKGGGAPNQVSCNDFLDWINTNDLACMPFTGSSYSWCNGRRGLHRIHRRLDRALCNGVCLDFYKTLYAESISHDQDTGNMEDFIGTYVPNLVSSDENMMLMKCPDILEIKNVVFNLNGNSAPGLDGFGGVFYHSCWDIIGTDVCNAVQQFFKQNWVLPIMNSNVVSLISKFQGVESIKDYRPIVVANFKFKIISKILADRLALVAVKIISPNQYGFVQGIQIQDYIGIASEAINMLSKKV